MVRAFLLLDGARADKAERPPLELKLVFLSERGGFIRGRWLADDADDRFGGADLLVSLAARQRGPTFWLGAAHEFQAAAVGVLQAVLDEGNGQLRHVYADPVAAVLLGGVNGRAAAAERVEGHDDLLLVTSRAR